MSEERELTAEETAAQQELERQQEQQEPASAEEPQEAASAEDVPPLAEPTPEDTPGEAAIG